MSRFLLHRLCGINQFAVNNGSCLCWHWTGVAQLGVSMTLCDFAQLDVNTRCLRYLLSSIAQYKQCECIALLCIAQYNNVNIPPYCAKCSLLFTGCSKPVYHFVNFTFFIYTICCLYISRPSQLSLWLCMSRPPQLSLWLCMSRPSQLSLWCVFRRFGYALLWQ